MSATARLDAFTDAAFAFAVTLMVVGTGDAPLDYAALSASLRTVPSFVIGFAIIAMFWWAHVCWRVLRGEGRAVSTFLTLLLVFTVLVYVHPLRAMAASFAAYLGGGNDGFGADLGRMFALYGIGFVAMSTIIALLYAEALRSGALAGDERREALGQAIVYLILAATGLVSTIVALLPRSGNFAGMVYATLPITVGLFVSRWDWGASRPSR